MIVLEISSHSSYPMSILFNPSSLVNVVFDMLKNFRWKVSERKKERNVIVIVIVNDVELNEWWCFRSSIIGNRFSWKTIICELSCCCIWKYAMIVHCLFDLMWFLILDLPKLHTISFDGDYALEGDGGDDRKREINGHESYANTLIMRSTLVDWLIDWNVNCVVMIG